MSNLVKFFLFLELLTAVMANAEVCAPDVSYLKPKLHPDTRGTGHSHDSLAIELDRLKTAFCCNGSPDASETPVEHLKLEYGAYVLNFNRSRGLGQDSTEEIDDSVLVNQHKIKQLECIESGGVFAESSANFDANGNYKGSTKQAASSSISKSQAEVELPEWLASKNQSDQDSINKDRENSNKKSYRKLKNCLHLVHENNNDFVYNGCNVKASYAYCWDSAPTNNCQKQDFGGFFVAPKQKDVIPGPGDDSKAAYLIWFAACEYPGIPEGKGTKWTPKGIQYSCK